MAVLWISYLDSRIHSSSHWAATASGALRLSLAWWQCGMTMPSPILHHSHLSLFSPRHRHAVCIVNYHEVRAFRASQDVSRIPWDQLQASHPASDESIHADIAKICRYWCHTATRRCLVWREPVPPWPSGVSTPRELEFCRSSIDSLPWSLLRLHPTVTMAMVNFVSSESCPPPGRRRGASGGCRGGCGGGGPPCHGFIAPPPRSCASLGLAMASARLDIDLLITRLVLGISIFYSWPKEG